MEEVEQRGARLELDQEVEIAAFVLVAARSGAEERDSHAAMPTDDRTDLVGPFDDNLAKPWHQDAG